MPYSQEFEMTVLRELSEIKANGATTAAKLDGLEDRLFNGGSGVIHTLQADIQEIKDDAQREKKKDFIHRTIHYSLVPVYGLLHAIARHFGINV